MRTYVTIYQGTKARSAVPVLATEDPEVELQMMRLAVRVLGAEGLERYEVSSFARPGRECRHNLNYWRNGSYLGLGPAAASYLDGERPNTPLRASRGAQLAWMTLRHTRLGTSHSIRPTSIFPGCPPGQFSIFLLVPFCNWLAIFTRLCLWHLACINQTVQH